MASSKAVEQLLGRILRLPRARRKERAELNAAYAFVASRKFFEAAQSLKDALIENGFQRMEADQFVIPEPPKPHPTLFDPGSLFPEVQEQVSEPPDFSNLSEDLKERIEYDEQRRTIIVTGELDTAAMVELQKCVKKPEDRAAVERLHQKSRGRRVEPETAVQKELVFSIPKLALRIEGLLEPFEEEHFLDVEWNLADCDASLTEKDFPSSYVAGQEGELDVTDEGAIDVRFIDQMQRQLRLLGREPGWDLPNFVNWLDRKIPHPDITRTQSTLFLHKAIEGLIESRAVTVEQLAQQKFRLRTALADKIAEHRRSQRKNAFQQVLFESRLGEVEVDPDVCFQLSQDNYAPNWYYEGPKLPKHLFPVIGELKSEGEEFECAAFIAQHPKVKYWIRNLERRPEASFWLQTSTDRFYPDFLALLEDGRILVVESKGEHLWSNDDSKEKRAVGDLWAARSGGKCLFVMPKGPDWNAIQAAIE